MIKVSVIIPVYNTEIYLKQCLESAINQTLKDIEIICVNDGSTDNSLEILNQYKEKDSRIIIINQENKGLSRARNEAIKIAEGKYIHFLDSDDFYYENYALEKLYKNMIENNLDILFFDIINFYEKTGEKIKYQSNRLKENIIYNGKKILENYLVNEVISSSNCYKIFKKELFNYVDYKPNIYFEDGELLLRILSFSNKIMAIRDIFLCIRERENSITTSFKEKYIDSLIKIFETIDKIEENSISENDKDFYKLGLLSYVIKLYLKAQKRNKKIEKRIDVLKREKIRIQLLYFFKKKFNKRIKLERLILYLSTFWYMKLFEIYVGRK